MMFIVKQERPAVTPYEHCRAQGVVDGSFFSRWTQNISARPYANLDFTKERLGSLVLVQAELIQPCSDPNAYNIFVSA